MNNFDCVNHGVLFRTVSQCNLYLGGACDYTKIPLDNVAPPNNANRLEPFEHKLIVDNNLKVTERDSAIEFGCAGIRARASVCEKETDNVCAGFRQSEGIR